MSQRSRDLLPDDHGAPISAAPNRPSGAPEAELPLLNLLRFVAAALVMLNHLRGNQFLPYQEVSAASSWLKFVFFCLTRIGLEAVVLFFVLSGFLVGGAAVDRAMRGTFDPAKYFIDRFTRIYTPFVPALVLTIVVRLWLDQPFSWVEAGMNALSLQGAFAQPFSGNTALWSLSYEVWFYISCGAVLTLFRAPAVGVRSACIVVLFAAAVIFSQLLIAYVFAWLFGLGAYFLRSTRAWLAFCAGAVLTGAGLVLMQLTSVSNQVDLAAFTWIDRSIAILILAGGFALLVAACAQVRARSRWAVRLGLVCAVLASFSYTLYLLHNPLISLLQHWNVLARYDRLDALTLGGYLANATLILALCYAILPALRATDASRPETPLSQAARYALRRGATPVSFTLPAYPPAVAGRPRPRADRAFPPRVRIGPLTPISAHVIPYLPIVFAAASGQSRRWRNGEIGSFRDRRGSVE